MGKLDEFPNTLLDHQFPQRGQCALKATPARNGASIPEIVHARGPSRSPLVLRIPIATACAGKVGMS